MLYLSQLSQSLNRTQFKKKKLVVAVNLFACFAPIQSASMPVIPNNKPYSIFLFKMSLETYHEDYYIKRGIQKTNSGSPDLWTLQLYTMINNIY